MALSKLITVSVVFLALAALALAALALASVDRAQYSLRPRRAIHDAAASGEYYTAYGICAPYPGYSTRTQLMIDQGYAAAMATCDPYVADHKDMVFYYTNIWPEGDNLTHSYLDVLGGIQTLSGYMTSIPATCRDVLLPFICQQAFSPCIYLNSTESNVTEGIAIRNSTCRSTCNSVFSTCSTFLNNPLVANYMDAQPSLKYYRPCTANDTLVDVNQPTYPDGNFTFWFHNWTCNSNLPSFIWPSPVPPPPPPAPASVPTSAATSNGGTPASTIPSSSTPSTQATSTTATNPTKTGAERLTLSFVLAAVIVVAVGTVL